MKQATGALNFGHIFSAASAPQISCLELTRTHSSKLQVEAIYLARLSELESTPSKAVCYMWDIAGMLTLGGVSLHTT